MQTDRRSAGARALFVAFAAMLGASAVGAEEAREPMGKPEFLRYCAACHGESARGDGPVSESIKKKIPDLTTLRERYGKPLPRAKLIESIDGTQLTHAHGTRDMPVWGQRFYGGLGGAEKDGRIRGTILVILDYLDSIQQ